MTEDTIYIFIIIYLTLGVILNFLLDILCNYLETPNELSILERILVGIFWPWSLCKLISEYFKINK